VNSADGGFETIEDKIDYDIPKDQMFRNYRFIYNPSSGKAEVFVNNVIIWSHEGNANTAMYWKDAEDIIIGKGIDGGGIDRPVFDNLIVRSTGSITPLAQSLLNFMLMPSDNTVKIMWSNTDNDKIDNFSIERSVNGFDFASLTIIQPEIDTKEISDYSFSDKNISNPGILYYRLRQNFKDGKFITHPVSAIRININRELTIEKVSPAKFQTTFNMSYYLPTPGRVWVQMLDSDGRMVNSDTFVAEEGKNLYVYTDKSNLTSGTYTVNIIFNDRKATAYVSKEASGETVVR
jgi:hypothetical protein